MKKERVFLMSKHIEVTVMGFHRKVTTIVKCVIGYATKHDFKANGDHLKSRSKKVGTQRKKEN